MSAPLLEQFVFAKPFFDPAGLIVAERDGRPVGFVHAGFGPNEEQSALATDLGTTYLLLLHRDAADAALADELLERSEAYLRERGAKVIYGGGIRPLDGFYLGLYGGSELPGVLATNSTMIDALHRANYREIDRVFVLERDLVGFRPAVSRELRRLRRIVTSGERTGASPATWWEACTIGAFERLDMYLESVETRQVLASVSFWDIEPLSTGWGAPTAGMFDLFVAPEMRRQGLATHLLGEAFQRLRTQGIVRVEAQTMQANEPARALYAKLGFRQVDEGVVFRKAE